MSSAGQLTMTTTTPPENHTSVLGVYAAHFSYSMVLHNYISLYESSVLIVPAVPLSLYNHQKFWKIEF